MQWKGIIGEICDSIYWYAKANKNFTKYNAKNKETSYLQHQDANLFEWAMSQKLPVKNFKWVKDIYKSNEGFITSYNEESNNGYFIEVDVQYPEKLHDLHNNVVFLPERMKIEKFKKLAANLHDKIESVIHIRNLKQA